MYIDSLAQESTVGDFELALENLPIGLDEIYKQAKRRIESQGEKYKRLAKKVLSWVVYTQRPLSIAELQHAVAIQAGKMDLNGKSIPSVGVIRSICAGLITIDTQNDAVRLVHYTAQEYLERTSKDWFPEAETYITMTCVTYLSFEIFESGFCQTDEEFEERLQINPFYDYAARNWGHHALTAPLEIKQLILDFLRNDAKVSASTQVLFTSESSWRGSGYSQDVPRGAIGVHLAAYFGLPEIMMALLENRDHLNIKDEWGRTPLSWAAEQGHEAIVKLLVEMGAELESRDDSGRRPLSWAAGEGHEAVVKLLLDKGAELEFKDEFSRTPLSQAAAQGHEAVVKLLLEKGAGLDHKDVDNGQTPLSWAAENGHEEVVRLLLEKGADPDSSDKNYQTPLFLATRHGYEATVKLLLQYGAVPDWKENSGRTPLSWAAENGHETMVKLLLQKGAEPDSEDGFGRTPLSWAVEKGHEAVVKLLISRDDVEVVSADPDGKTPLSWALEEEHRKIVKPLSIHNDVVAISLADSESGLDSMGGSSNLIVSSKTSLIDTLDSINQVKPDPTHDNVGDDVESLASAMDDIDSQRSTSKIPQVKMAENHLADILAQHSHLISLHKDALSKIGAARFIENFRRLLKIYYLDLRQNADTNLKRASIDVLKKRWSRHRIAQQIVEIYEPCSDEIKTGMQKPEDRQARMSGIELWIVRNRAFSSKVHSSEHVHSVKQDEETNMQHWEIESSSEESDSETESHAIEPWPNIAEMEKFILGGIAFQNLIANFHAFLLPRDLRTQITRALLCIPKKDRWFSSEEDLSFQNRFKIFAESITEQDWDWWPFRAKMRPLKKNETRLHWYCVSTPLVQTNITSTHIFIAL